MPWHPPGLARRGDPQMSKNTHARRLRTAVIYAAARGAAAAAGSGLASLALQWLAHLHL